MHIKNAVIITFLVISINNILKSQTLSTFQIDSLESIRLFLEAYKAGKNDEPEKALELYQQSLVLRIKTFGEKHYRLGSTYSGMAIQYKNMHQLEAAYKFYKIAEEMYLFNGPANDSRLGDVYSNIGNYFQIKGDLSEAIRYQERAVSIYQNLKVMTQLDKDNYLSVIYNLANAYYMSDREKIAFKLALDHYNKGSLNHYALFKDLMADIYEFQDDFQKSLTIRRELIYKVKSEDNNHELLPDQFVSYGISLSLIGQTDSAIYYFSKAERTLLIKKHNERDLAALYSYIANSYIKKNVNSSTLVVFQEQKKSNLDTALSYYLKALYSLRETQNKADITLSRLKTSNFPVPNLEILLKIGRTYQQLAAVLPEESKEKKKEYLTEALFYTGTGSDFAEYLRTTFISENSKMQFTEIQADIFTLAVQVAFELYRLTGNEELAEKAFQNMEKKKAASLFDQLSEMQSRSVSLIPDSLTEKETRLSTSLTYLKERLFSEMNADQPDSARIFEFKARIFDTEQELNQLRIFLENNFKDYYQTKYGQKPITFENIRKKIQPGEVVLSYSLNMPDSLNEGSLYIFAVSKKSRRFMKQPVNEQTINDIRKVYSVLSSNQFINSGIREYADFCASSYRLYNLLIFPFREMIAEKRLTIIPDGLLGYLPFEALLTHMPDTTSIHFYDLPYMVLRHPVTYSYSSRLLYHKSSNYTPFFTRALAFSPAYPAYNLVNNDSVYLPPIPGIYDEVRFLGRKVKTHLFTGVEATEKNFREQCGKFEILHLAMHTLINDSLPMLSRLAFYQENRDSLDNDGWLTTADIYYLHLKAKMVVLSACKSGGGNLRSGEGIMSLARGFFYAGSPSVLMSLWDVEDMSATRIMKSYYRNLRLGKTKDRALQEAKISYLKDADPLTSHPHLWMGMIVIGNPEPLFHGKEKYFLILIAIILIYLTIDLIRKKPAG